MQGSGGSQADQWARVGYNESRHELRPRSKRLYRSSPEPRCHTMPPTRREFLKSTGAAGLATALAAAASRTQAQTAIDAQPRTVRTDHLDIGYEEHGNRSGTAVVLLHGFPFDVRSFYGVVAPLVAAGHRVLVPWLRGYGP